MENKTKVSRFEYAIKQAANVPDLDKFEPLTEKEELKIREDRIREQFNRLKPINHGK